MALIWTGLMLSGGLLLRTNLFIQDGYTGEVGGEVINKVTVGDSGVGSALAACNYWWFSRGYF